MNVKELKNICKDFITNPNINILSICAFMGSGKTHFILKDLLQIEGSTTERETGGFLFLNFNFET